MDYYTVAETARKNGVKLRAGKRRGLYFTLMRYQRRVGLYVGAVFNIYLPPVAYGYRGVSVRQVIKDSGTFPYIHQLAEKNNVTQF